MTLELAASPRHSGVTRDLIALASDNNVEMFDRFLAVSDSIRAVGVLHRLAQHRVETWALTGGLAMEIHFVLAGAEPQRRSLNDLDFVAAQFADIPETLAEHFLFRHVHPKEIPGRTMAQFVDVAAKLRIDVFRANGASMARASQVTLATGTIKILALEDLIARLARVSLDLADGIPTPKKYALDFLRLSKLKTSSEVQPAWRDHRKPSHPLSFVDVSHLLHELIPSQHDLLIIPDYSKDVSEGCRRCAPTPKFPLADPAAIVSILGCC
jgi:hypothetical protein